MRLFSISTGREKLGFIHCLVGFPAGELIVMALNLGYTRLTIMFNIKDQTKICRKWKKYHLIMTLKSSGVVLLMTVVPLLTLLLLPLLFKHFIFKSIFPEYDISYRQLSMFAVIEMVITMITISAFFSEQQFINFIDKVGQNNKNFYYHYNCFRNLLFYKSKRNLKRLNSIILNKTPYAVYFRVHSK